MALATTVPPISAPQAEGIQFPLRAETRVFHFVQGASRAVLEVLATIPNGDYVLAVSYDQPLDPADPRVQGTEQGLRALAFWPKSSWAAGRNLGWRVARALGDRIEYAAFLDDDVVFSRGDYPSFVDAVLTAQPLIAAPIVPRTSRTKYILSGRTVQAGSIQDQQIMLFHRSALTKPHLWPLTEAYDDTSWHVPCIVQEYMIFHHHRNQLAQFNAFEVLNEGHVWEDDSAETADSVYQMDRDFHRVRRLAFEYCEQVLGERPGRGNDIFGGIKAPPPSLKDRLDRFLWRHGGRHLYMRRLKTLG